jgi:hypothetical protein
MVPEPISIAAMRCCVCGSADVVCFDPGRAEERDPKLFLILRGWPPRARCLEHWRIISHGEIGQNRAKVAHGQVVKD